MRYRVQGYRIADNEAMPEAHFESVIDATEWMRLRESEGYETFLFDVSV